MMESIKKRVDKGVGFLDQNAPGWRDEIDLGSLDMKSSCNCILGQVFGSFSAGMDELRDKPEKLGFDIYLGHKFSALQGEWEKRLTEKADDH